MVFSNKQFRGFDPTEAWPSGDGGIADSNVADVPLVFPRESGNFSLVSYFLSPNMIRYDTVPAFRKKTCKNF